jgi:hypothetical protein
MILRVGIWLIGDFFVDESQEEKTEVDSSDTHEHLSGLFAIDLAKAFVYLLNEHLNPF